MTYSEAISFLFGALPVWERQGSGAYKPGLERISAFLELLGNPQERFPTVHVAGTNGKGSTASMLAAVLQSADLRPSPFSVPPPSCSGRVEAVVDSPFSAPSLPEGTQNKSPFGSGGRLKVGLFTSPHLVDFRERIRIDGQPISEAAVVEFTERWRDDMVRLGLTFFEMTTALALWFFAGGYCDEDCGKGTDPERNAADGRFSRQMVDIAVIEAGLGGRLDSTNVITPLVSVITNIGLEHTDYLGDTIAAIAAEKAGIIKRGVPVVVGESDAQSAPVFRARAAELGSEIVFADNPSFEETRQPDAAPSGRRRLSEATRRAETAASGQRAATLNGGLKLACAHFTSAGDGLTSPGGADESLDDSKYRVSSSSHTQITSSSNHLIIKSPHHQLDLPGDHQWRNARTVLAAVNVLRKTFTISDEAVVHGLTHTTALTGLRGRWEVLREAPLVVCDTAHNAHGFSAVACQIERQMEALRVESEVAKVPSPRLFVVLGLAADKDLDAVMELLPHDAYYIATQADTPRAMAADELAHRLETHLKTHLGNHHENLPETHPENLPKIETATPVHAAYLRARELASPTDMIFVGGSNFVVGELLAAL